MKNQTRFREVMAVFDCRHQRPYKLQYRPEEGDRLWCFTCHAMRTVTAIMEEYRIRCANCSVTRRFGQAKLNAEIFGSRHHQRHPAHEVHLFYGKEERHRWSAQTEQLFAEALPSGPAEPPF
jgi:hypothetical protein